jgi:NitT/TauT family transport system permease protein
MVWKVVIAAEVLTVPRYGVGSRMQLAQVQLETDRVLSWTLVAVFLTAFGDLVFTFVVDGVGALKHHLDARRVPCVS